MLRPHCPQPPGPSNGRGLRLASLTPTLLLGLWMGLGIALSSCIPRWDKCGSNDFTCNTAMQLLSFSPGSVVMVGGTNSPSTAPFYAVSMDDGDTWSIGTLSGFGSTALTTMNFADGRFLAGTNTTHFFETRDSGTTWNPISTAAAVTAPGGVSHADGRYIVHDSTASAGVHTMPDGGSTWTSLGTAGAAASNSSSVLVAGGILYVLSQPNGFYYHTSPGTWTPIAGMPVAPFSMCTESGIIYIATGSQLYAGQAGRQSVGSVGTPFGIAAGAGNNYMACHGSTFVVPVGIYCDVAVSTNGGASWTTVNLGCGDSVAGVTYTGKKYVAATSTGAIHVSDDALTWNQIAITSGYTWTGIAANRAAFYY